jgi:hypothetical protein
LYFFPKCAKTHLRASAIPKIFLGLYPGPPLRRERKGFRRRKRDKWGRKGDKRGRNKGGKKENGWERGLGRKEGEGALSTASETKIVRTGLRFLPNS